MGELTTKFRLVGDNGDLVGELRVADKEFDKLDKTVKKNSKSAGALSKKLRSVALQVVSVTAAYRGLSSIITIGAEFSRQMANVASVAGATADELDRLASAAREQAKVSVFSAREAAEAQYFLASAGLEVNQIIEAQRGIMDLAAATQADLGRTSEITTATLSQFNLEAADASRVANVFAASISGSQATINKLGDAMRFIGPVANSLDQDLESTTAAISLLFNAGFRGEQAGTALRSALVALTKPSKEAGDLIDRMGLEVFDAAGKFVGFESLIRQLSESQLDLNQAATLFGTEAAPAMLALVRQGVDEYLRFLDSITRTNKATEMANQQMDQLEGDWKLLKSAAEELALNLFDRLEPALRAVTQAATEMIKSLTPDDAIKKLEFELLDLERKLLENPGQGLLHDWVFGDEEDIRSRIQAIGAELADLKGLTTTNVDPGLIADWMEPFDDLDSVVAQMREWESVTTDFSEQSKKAGESTNNLTTEQQGFMDSLKEEARLMNFTGKELKIQTALGRAHALGIKDQDALIRKWAGSTFKLNKTQSGFMDSLKEEARLLQFTGKELAIQTELGRAHAQGVTDQDEAIRELVGSMYDLEQAQEAAKDSAEPIAEIYKDTATSIRQSFRDTLRDVFDNGLDGFKGFADRMKNLFKDMLADMATMAIARPIIVPIVSGMGNMLGVSQPAQASVMQQLGGSAVSGAGSNLASTGMGKVAGSFGGYGGAFMGAGAGAYYGYKQNGMRGAVVGGVAGFAGGAALTAGVSALAAGWGAGASLGAAAAGGMAALAAIPVWGWAALAALAIFGSTGSSKAKVQVASSLNADPSLFFSSRETPFGVVGVTRDGRKLGNLGEPITDFLAGIDESIAAMLSPEQIETVKSGITGGGTLIESPIKAKQFDNEIFDVAKVRLTRIIDALADNNVASKLLDEIPRGEDNVEQLVGKAQEIVQLINLFQDPGEPINQAQQALNTLNDQFDQLAETAANLGFSVEDAESKRADAIQQLTTDFDEAILNQIQAIEDPFTQALENQALVAEERLDNARTLGAELVEVERLNALERAAIIEQQFSSLNDLINQVSLESLTPAQQLDSLVADFNDAVASNDIAGLNTVTRDLISAGKDAFASGPQFQELLAQVVAALQAVQDSAADQTAAAAPQITIKFIAPDGEEIKEETIQDILERSQQGEIVVDARGVAS